MRGGNFNLVRSRGTLGGMSMDVHLRHGTAIEADAPPVATGDKGGATPADATVEVFGAGVSMDGDRSLSNGSAARQADGSRNVVVLVGGCDSELVQAAAARGLASRVAQGGTLDEVIALVLKQLDDVERLKTVAARTGQLERAKGILMERHKLSEREAHDRMRRHARKLNTKLTAVAEAVESSYLLLPLEDA